MAKTCDLHKGVSTIWYLDNAEGCPLCVAVAQLEEQAAESQRLAREIDVALHGEKNAADQASLCDLVGPAKLFRTEAEAYKRLAQGLDKMCTAYRTGSSRNTGNVIDEVRKARSDIAALQTRADIEVHKNPTNQEK